MTSFPYGETVVMLQPTVRVDDLGDRVEDWEHWSMLFKQPVVGSDYRCRWRIRGVVWEADGSPMVWHHPMSGWDTGTQINVKRKKG